MQKEGTFTVEDLEVAFAQTSEGKYKFSTEYGDEVYTGWVDLEILQHIEYLGEYFNSVSETIAVYRNEIAIARNSIALNVPVAFSSKKFAIVMRKKDMTDLEKLELVVKKQNRRIVHLESLLQPREPEKLRLIYDLNNGFYFEESKNVNNGLLWQMLDDSFGFRRTHACPHHFRQLTGVSLKRSVEVSIDYTPINGYFDSFQDILERLDEPYSVENLKESLNEVYWYEVPFISLPANFTWTENYASGHSKILQKVGHSLCKVTAPHAEFYLKKYLEFIGKTSLVFGYYSLPVDEIKYFRIKKVCGSVECKEDSHEIKKKLQELLKENADRKIQLHSVGNYDYIIYE